jgi:serine protein kinase
LGIPARYLTGKVSPSLAKQLQKNGGDVTKLTVIKVYPNQSLQLAIAKTEPGDENNQDISALVGKVDIRKLETYAQDDADAYSYSGGLCKAHRGLLEFVEMFKAPIKVLHPLLTATQEGNYNPTEALPSIPFDGIIVAHSNESEWEKFKNNKDNEAYLDRICIIKVPNCTRVLEVKQINQKLINNSELANAPIAPHTLDILSKFQVLTRIQEPDNSSIFTKMKVYDGENLKDKVPDAKSLIEYKNALKTKDEGMDGMSSRAGFKILSKVFNFDSDEVAANPVHLLHILEQYIKKEILEKDTEEKYLAFTKYLAKDYVKLIGDELNTALLESSGEYGQALFDRYVIHADAWIQDQDYKDPDTGCLYDRDKLNQELEGLEKAARISNPKDFRHEIVHFCLRHKASNKGKMPKWNEYEPIKQVIKENIFGKTKDLMPVLSFGKHSTKDEDRKHREFVDRMLEKGYTEKQVRLLVEWHMQASKTS